MKCEFVTCKVLLPPITPQELERILPTICDKETAYDSKKWTPANPLYSHCTAVSLVAQNLFGGKLLCASLKDEPKFKHMKSHYWNELPDGTRTDFTKPQFRDDYPVALKPKVKRREDVLRFLSVARRYKLLALRLAKTLNNNNPIFDDPIYRACFETALESDCQKMKFGCVVTHDSKVVYQGSNKTIEALKSLCEGECIRFKIQSRTDQMLGSCGHAEEFALWEVAKKKIPLDESDLYIAGMYPNGMPWLKKTPQHTCLRCSIQMHNSGIRKIYVPVIDKWVGITSEEALQTALAYATKEKSVETKAN